MAPDDAFAALHRAAEAACGARLFTVTVIDREAGVARRAYSSHPRDYPVTGTKPIGDGPWTARVVERGEIFVANETAGFSPHFPDHALINALGCEAVANVPVTNDGQVVGTVNVLHVAGHFTPERVAALIALVDGRRAALVMALSSMPMGDET